MNPDDHIKILYKTPAGTTWETFNEAIIAHRIEQSSIYLPDYQLKIIVQAAANPTKEELGTEE